MLIINFATVAAFRSAGTSPGVLPADPAHDDTLFKTHAPRPLTPTAQLPQPPQSTSLAFSPAASTPGKLRPPRVSHRRRRVVSPTTSNEAVHLVRAGISQPLTSIPARRYKRLNTSNQWSPPTFFLFRQRSSFRSIRRESLRPGTAVLAPRASGSKSNAGSVIQTRRFDIVADSIQQFNRDT